MNRLMNRPMLVCLIANIVGICFLSGIAPATSSAARAPSTAPSESVGIDNFKFSPRILTVSVGTTVTWTNHDDVPHTATGKGDSPAFDSKALDTDEKFSFTFTSPGRYPYYCKVHPHMTGLIIVK